MKPFSPRTVSAALALCALVAIMRVAIMLAGCSSSYVPPERSSPPAPPAPPIELPLPPGVSANQAQSNGARSIAPGARIGRAPSGAAQSLLTRPSDMPPAPDEELWIIQKAPTTEPATSDEIPGSGALMAKRAPTDTPEQMVPVPLKHTDVKGSIVGYIATVDVQQQFQNPYPEKIEAVYVFSLPNNAAVSEFVMTIGQRHIRGVIREREEARKMYVEARRQGYVASLLTQERPNIFTQSVANIEPGKRIDIDIKYFNTLAYHDGWYEFVFPMVVGPRFNPPGMTDGIGAVAQGARGASGQTTEVTYLRPEQRSGHDISLSVALNVGTQVARIESLNHDILLNSANANAMELPARQPMIHPAGSYAEDPNREQWTVRLSPHDAVPNKDFVLRWQPSVEQVRPAMALHRGDHGGYFSLMLLPPTTLTHLPRKPLEMILTVDVSGSQQGAPLLQEKAATRYCLMHMGPEDTFQVVRFGNTAQSLFPKPMPASPQNVAQALQWVDGFDANEGTMLTDAVRASLLIPPDPSRPRYVAFLTDGFIGNEAEALAEVHRCIGAARIFSFGVGSSTNRYLLDHMARMGNGAAAYLGLHDKAEQVMGAYFDRISHPALTDITIDWGGMKASEVFPRKIPDLFVGRPVILTGRFEGHGSTILRVHGKIGPDAHTIEIPVNLDQPVSDSNALPRVWARSKIADLSDQSTYEGSKELPDAVRQVALEYGMASAYTAFIAVDSLHKTAGDHGVSIPVAVPMPDGIRYDTTVDAPPGKNTHE